MARGAEIVAVVLLLGACEPTRPAELPKQATGDVRRISTVASTAAPAPPPRAPNFTLAPRDAGVGASEYHPCTQCHEAGDEVDRQPRVLEDDHDDLKLVHGTGKIWCLDCHHPEERDALLGARGEAVPFAQPHRACGRCHAGVARDFAFGVHGRREGNWRGERVLLSCLACHRAHDPAIPARRPASGPTPRADLPQPVHHHEPTRLHRAIGGGER